MLVENQGSGGGEFLFCLDVCILNSFCMEKMVRSNQHQQRDRKKRDMLSFRLELEKQLIGNFSTRCRNAGHPQSVKHLQLDRMNVN